MIDILYIQGYLYWLGLECTNYIWSLITVSIVYTKSVVFYCYIC